MAKGKAIGTAVLVLLGVLFKPLSILSSGDTELRTVEASKSSIDTSRSSVYGDGPWIASCRYWAAVSSRPQKDGDCRRTGNRWGIPNKSHYFKPSITAIVAAVPNPLHSRLSLQFDRTIDALLEAAADQGFVQSYYWLPWQTPIHRSDNDLFPHNSDLEKKHLEDEPGLILLKSACALKNETQVNPVCDPLSSYTRVIYLFVVGNSPVEGMDGGQLNRAFRYEQELKGVLSSTTFSLKKSKVAEVDIIASESSGSAASMRAAIDHAFSNKMSLRIAGATSTTIATDMFKGAEDHADPKNSDNLSYLSFAADICSESQALPGEHSLAGPPVAFLVEDGTAFGKGKCQESKGLTFRYPVGISMLRNAQMESSIASTARALSPYIPFSLRDSIPDDTVLRFSPNQTPLSQQAQLIEISRELRQRRVRFVVIQSSSPLDRIFLANFIYRTVPDARLVFLGDGDLLQETGMASFPLLGSLNITPFAPITLQNPADASLRVFPDHNSEAIYNAASYTFWDGYKLPGLASYTRYSNNPNQIHASLWATVIGRDGVYPLRVINQCASSSGDVLPSFEEINRNGITEACQEPYDLEQISYPQFAASVHPTWFGFCVLVSFLSFLRILVLSRASFRSPLTRELAINTNDEPRRRALYICVGSLTLFCGAFILCYALYAVRPSINKNAASVITAAITLFMGCAEAIYTIIKTGPYLFPRKNPIPFVRDSLITDLERDDSHWYRIIYLALLIGVVAFIALWIGFCTKDATPKDSQGLFFSYRSLNLISGVSPITPILLLLTGWYLWSIIQTRRLRFSPRNKPALPRRTGDLTGDLLFVAEEDLEESPRSEETPLFRTMSGLLIVREMFKRKWPSGKRWVLDCCFALLYALFFFVCLRYSSFTTLEDIFENGLLSYGRLLQVLLIGLLLIGLAGWIRASMIWREFARRILWPLEESPLRRAFTRFSDVNWVLMMRQNGVVQRWREGARSAESMRQLLQLPEIRNAIGLLLKEDLSEPDARDYGGYTALIRYTLAAKFFSESDPKLLSHLAQMGVVKGENSGDHRDIGRRNCPWEKLIAEIEADPKNKEVIERFLAEGDSPKLENRGELLLMYLAENEYGAFATLLLKNLLIPFWRKNRLVFVASTEGKDSSSEKNNETGSAEEPLYIQLAEEFVTIRYVSMIRAVLINIRHLMSFMSIAFVCAIAAWNSYPFRPRQRVDGVLTVVLLFICGGTIWIFSQMYRDPLLSRITGTEANELGSEFYLRVLSTGAIPILTWVAYHFPSISNTIQKYIQPGLSSMK